MTRLQNELTNVQRKILAYQTKCKHPNASKKECGDTGNWCPSDDRYWTEYKCPDCLKFWSVDYK